LLLTGDLSNNKKLIRGYINRLDTLLPIRFFDKIKDDKSLVSSYKHRILYVLEKYPGDYESVPKEFKTDPRYAERLITLYVLEKDPFNYIDVPDELKTDPRMFDITLYVLEEEPDLYKDVPDSVKALIEQRKNNEETEGNEEEKEARIKGWINVLEEDPDLYEDVPDELKTDPRIKEAAINGSINVLKKYPDYYQYVPYLLYMF
jgi:hypothetical protein